MRPSAARPPSAAWLFLLGAVLALFGTHAGRYWDFTVDDAGISFAYARHLADGHGLVLTPGAERVEAATNLLWCLALTPAKWLGVSHELLAKVLGLAGATGGLVGVALFPSVAYQRRARYYDLVAPLVAAFMPHYALWCVSGLENGLFSGLAAAALLAVAHEENDPRRFPWSAPLLVLLFATRPDGILYAAAIGAAKALRQVTPRPPRQDVVWGLALAGGIAAIELFRLAYFAWPWPNSFYTKKRTFDFGKDLFDTRKEGWTYVGRWLQEYKLARAVYLVPLALLGLRAPVARIALVGAVAAAFFFPIYSHGDWMEEFRFLTFGAPLFALAVAEGARAVARVALAVLPYRPRVVAALALTPLAAYGVLSETLKHYPDRMRAATSHQTLEFKYVQARARYFVAAARRLSLDRRPGLLDPDVGGSSYDGRLTIVDLFGLGDIPIAHTHPENPPGSREAIFWERRPEFVHLHGAWFGAMELHRLEELTHGYLRLPARLPEGDVENDANYVRRDAIAAPWYVTAQAGTPGGAARAGTFVDGYTVSHGAVEPGRRVMVELTVASYGASPPGSLALVPEGAPAGRRAVEVPIEPAGGILEPSGFLPGERPRARAWFAPARGRYRIAWRSEGNAEGVALGSLACEPGAGARESRALRAEMEREVRAGRFAAALRLARRLGLRVVADPRDADALEALGVYGRALADRAHALAEGGAPLIAAALAREARRWAADDARTVARVNAVAERLADGARAAERARDAATAFTLAREAVLTDPRRSWARRRAEELRPRRMSEYDGGRDVAAYDFAAAALAGTAELDRAIVYLGTTSRWVEAAGLADRAGRAPEDPRARVVVARGRLARGEALEALALVAGVACASARDPELTRGLRAVLGRPYRPGDAACERPAARDPAPFDDASGSFESPRWVGWTATGNAFGRGPVHVRAERQQMVNGWRGWHFASSFATGADERRGTLRSRPFTVTSEGISFLIGGGSDASVVGVRLVVDGEAVLQASGAGSEALLRRFWDVRPYAGRTAYLEVYDQAEGGWGHVMVDDFRLEPVMPPPRAAQAADASGDGASGE